MKTYWFILGLLLLFAASASAQTGALVSATAQFYQNGAALPSQTTVIALPSGATCAQPFFPTPPGTPAITSTGRISWGDPASPKDASGAFTQLCIAVQAAGATLFALPVGTNYTATLTFRDDLGQVSPPSAASNPFSRVAPLAAPTGVQVRP